METQTTARLITGEELLQMSGLGPCELVNGEIKKMSPTSWNHGSVEARIAHHLSGFVYERDLGEVMVGEVGLYTRRDPDTVRGVDALFISHARLAEASPEGYLDVAPELVVEVVSPSNTWHEMREKIEEYFAIGVEQVWIAEPKRQAVRVYRSPDEARTVRAGETLAVEEGALDGFAVPVDALFA